MKVSQLAALVVAAAGPLLAPLPALCATNVAVFNFQMKTETPDWKWLEKGLRPREEWSTSCHRFCWPQLTGGHLKCLIFHPFDAIIPPPGGLRSRRSSVCARRHRGTTNMLPPRRKYFIDNTSRLTLNQRVRGSSPWWPTTRT
jgi:hypothetical protein